MVCFTDFAQDICNKQPRTCVIKSQPDLAAVYRETASFGRLMDIMSFFFRTLGPSSVIIRKKRPASANIVPFSFEEARFPSFQSKYRIS